VDPDELSPTCQAHALRIVGDETERAYRRGDALDRRRALMDAWAAFLGRERHSAASSRRTVTVTSSTGRMPIFFSGRNAG